MRQREVIPFREIAKAAFQRYPWRAILGLALFIGQAFLYNGVTFNLGILYTTFWKVSSGFVPVFLIVFAVGNSGPGLEYPYYSPGLMGTSLRRPTAVTELQDEVDAIGHAVDEGGPIPRDDLYRVAGGRRMGPGRFGRALGEAVASGRIRRTGRGRFEPPEPGT